MQMGYGAAAVCTAWTLSRTRYPRGATGTPYSSHLHHPVRCPCGAAIRQSLRPRRPRRWVRYRIPRVSSTVLSLYSSRRVFRKVPPVAIELPLGANVNGRFSAYRTPFLRTQWGRQAGERPTRRRERRRRTKKSRTRGKATGRSTGARTRGTRGRAGSRRPKASRSQVRVVMQGVSVRRAVRQWRERTLYPSTDVRLVVLGSQGTTLRSAANCTSCMRN